MKTLIRNIGQIAGIVEESVLRKNGEEMSQTGTLDNAWILIDGERISSFGTMDGCPKDEADEVIDSDGGKIPTHILYFHIFSVYLPIGKNRTK